MQFKRGPAAAGQPLRELARLGIGQQLLRGPQRDGGCARAGALQADLAQVQLVRAEIGVGRVMLVEAANSGVTEQDAAAAVGLQAMFVGVDDDGVHVREGVIGGTRCNGQIFCKREVAAVGRVHMDTEAILLLQFKNTQQRIDGTDGGGAKRDHYRANATLAEHCLQRMHVHTAQAIAGNGCER